MTGHPNFGRKRREGRQAGDDVSLRRPNANVAICRVLLRPLISCRVDGQRITRPGYVVWDVFLLSRLCLCGVRKEEIPRHVNRPIADARKIASALNLNIGLPKTITRERSLFKRNEKKHDALPFSFFFSGVFCQVKFLCTRSCVAELNRFPNGGNADRRIGNWNLQDRRHV